MDVFEELLALADASLPSPLSENEAVREEIADLDAEGVAYDALSVLFESGITIPEDLLLRALDEYSDSWTFVELANEALERQRAAAA
ncbi:MAG: hypothetical protein ACFN0W_03750 [Propionibacterium acidifaciens]|uniref:hypothetical protein n=1 Tax=Propionibacterium acidifaciens TaxID=556499 RepID=UPI003615623A